MTPMQARKRREEDTLLARVLHGAGKLEGKNVSGVHRQGCCTTQNTPGGGRKESRVSGMASEQASSDASNN